MSENDDIHDDEDARAHREFVTTLAALADTLAPRLHDAGDIGELVRHGEEGLALDELAAAVKELRPIVTTAERNTLERLLHYFDPADLDPVHHRSIRDREAVLAAVTVVDP